MGCISSKAITRSMSIRDEYFNPGFHGRSVAWEDLLTSHGGNDQLLAFICSENETTNTRRSSSFALPSQSLDFVSNAKEETEVVKSISDDFGDLDFSRFTRSKSCQLLREKETFLDLDPNRTQSKLDWNDKNLMGSRSFHTVEEYDELLERIHKSKTSKLLSFEDYLSSLDDKLQELKSSDANQDEGSNQISTTDSLKDEGGKKVDNDLGQESSSCSVKSMEDFEKIVEKGWKRRAVAKELKSLNVSTVEFPAVARIRRWIQVEGQVYSPGSYITPKFGSYNDNATRSIGEEEDRENSVFSPELVAAFEDCMQQLQEEEDRILNHMDGYQTEQPADSKI